MLHKRTLIIKDYSGAVLYQVTVTTPNPEGIPALLATWMEHPKVQSLVISNPVLYFVEVLSKEEEAGESTVKTGSVFDLPIVIAAITNEFNLNSEDVNTAIAYLKGYTRSDIVKQEGVSLDCVKKRVQRLYSKTSVRSQMELYRKVVGCLKTMRPVKHLFEHY